MFQADRFARSLAFVLDDGDVVYPVRRMNRDTWQRTFRVAAASDARDDILEVHDEDELLEYVIRRRWCVRCSNENGERKGLFSIGASMVRSILLREEIAHHSPATT